MRKKDYLLLTGIFLIHLVLLFTLRFTAWPEMSLWPYLMTKGWLPYENIAIAHTPLLLIVLSAFYKTFGVGIIQLKIFTWGLILISDILIFVIVKKLWNRKVAFFSLIFYIFFLILYDGNGLWFDLFMGILAFSSFYFARKKKWFLVGFFWGLAFLSKQTAVWFLIPILIPIGLAIFNLHQPLRVKPYKVIGKIVMGALTVFVPFLLLILAFGILPDFYYWAIKFGITTLPLAQGQIQFPNLTTLAVSLFPFFVFLLFLDTKLKANTLNLMLWALAGMMGTYPRFEYFHFLPAVPYLAIACGLIFTKLKLKHTLTKVFVAAYLIGNIYLVGTYTAKNFNAGTRFYEENVKEVVLYIKYITNPGDYIFILNWWDNIYALTDTIPSTNPWVPQLSWCTEVPGIQEKMVESLEKNPPKLVVFNPYTTSGLSSYIPQKVYEFVVENYKLTTVVGGLEILTPNTYASR